MSGRPCKLCANPEAREKAVAMRAENETFKAIATKPGFKAPGVFRCLTNHEATAAQAELETVPAIAATPTFVEPEASTKRDPARKDLDSDLSSRAEAAAPETESPIITLVPEADLANGSVPAMAPGRHRAMTEALAKGQLEIALRAVREGSYEAGRLKAFLVLESAAAPIALRGFKAQLDKLRADNAPQPLVDFVTLKLIALREESQPEPQDPEAQDLEEQRAALSYEVEHSPDEAERAKATEQLLDAEEKIIRLRVERERKELAAKEAQRRTTAATKEQREADDRETLAAFREKESGRKKHRKQHIETVLALRDSAGTDREFGIDLSRLASKLPAGMVGRPSTYSSDEEANVLRLLVWALYTEMTRDNGHVARVPGFSPVFVVEALRRNELFTSYETARQRKENTGREQLREAASIV